MISLNEQVAVITGASGAVGRAVALGLASQGASLCLLGRRRAELEETARLSRERTSRAEPFSLDLAGEGSIAECAAGLRRSFGRVDLLIHCAGAISLGPMDRAPVAEFDRQFQINVRGPYALTQALLPLMPPSGGQIVFINSTAGLRSRAWVGQYAATKHALRAVADSLRDEVNGRGIRVLSVYLGRTASPMQASVHAAEGRPYSPQLLLQPEDVAEMVIHALRLPETAEVTDIRIRPMKKMAQAEGTGG